MAKENDGIDFWTAIIPIAFFFITLVFGLFLSPVVWKSGMLPLEILILIAFTFSTLFLLYKGYKWDHILRHVSRKVEESVGVIMILFSIGVLIGSWIVSGTIPMLIYYGISLVSPDWIYVFTFFICILFSLLTGTSWGSAGTIGLVMISIAQVYGADLSIVAGAIVGGSFFGDKLSPLSDTTNVASLASKVPLFDHISSMLYTTGPAAILAAIGYLFVSPNIGSQGIGEETFRPQIIADTMPGIKSIFHFNVLLLLPLVIVVWGSVTKKPIVLTLLGSSWLAMLLAFIFQEFSMADVFLALSTGFSIDMATGFEGNLDAINILNRGGLYNLINGITSCFLIFAFIGTLDVIDAIPTVIKSVMAKIKKRTHAVISALTATLLTNLTTSNQYATSFIIGEAFQEKFNNLKINRKVLSRSIEDAGTMMENLVPWTPSGIFMSSTLGVSALAYAPYQFLSLANIVIAYLFAVTGWCCFYGRKQ